MTTALAGETIHLGHVVLLASLLGKNDQTQTELTQTTGIEKSSVVLFLDFLEKDGWLTPPPPNRPPGAPRPPHRPRPQTLHPRRQETRRGGAKALAKFSPFEQAKLERLLTKLIASLDS